MALKDTGEQPPFPSLGLDELPEPVFATDAGNIVRYANAAALTLLGYAPEEMIGWPLDKIFPKPPAGMTQLFGVDPRPAKFETATRMKSGKSMTFSLVASPIKRDGKVVAVVYAGRDIRVSKLLEGEVRKARDYFRTIVDSAPIGICVTDLGRTVVMANRMAEGITGYRIDEMVGKTVSLYYPERSFVDGVDFIALRKNKAVSKELKFRRKDGETIPVSVTYGLVADPRGENEMIIESYSDQSDRERLDRLKNEFVYIAAHELRNPVTAIRLLLDLVFDDKRLTLEPVMRGYLLKIQEADERLLHLVDDLLEVSRSESGRLKIQVSPQNISEHVLAIFSELKPSALSKDVALRYIPLVKSPLVMADPGKLKEILSNLLTNAVKYNMAGGTVTVEHEVRGGMLLTHVSDTGIGLKDEDQERVFEKFWRSDDMAVRAQSGTGLGLFIVKELVERMGGDIHLRSKYGRGTMFTFTLPLVTERKEKGKG